MSFCFKQNEPVPKAIQRLGRERIEKALACLQDCHECDAIHGVRIQIKKARAVLRLVRESISKKAYRRQTGLLREAAQRLAATRDARVAGVALNELMEHFKGKFAPRTLQHVRAPLRIRADREARRFGKQKTARKVRQLLREARRGFDELTLNCKEWKALRPGVKTTYAQGRKDYLLAARHASSEHFHNWRKRVKQLGYQIRLLKPIWPEQMDAMAADLKMLGRYLGEDHDLFVLQERARESGDAQELETLDRLIAQRQRQLRASALALGSRIYAEKPSLFCQRLGVFWERWRKQSEGDRRLVR